MKICYFFSNFHLSSITGQAGLVDKLTNEAKKSSYTVSVVSNHTKGQRFEKKGIQYLLIPGLGDFKTYALNVPQIVRFLREIQPDMIHVNGALMTIYVWVITRFLHIPFVALITETTDRLNPLYKKLFAHASINCNSIFVTGNYLRNDLAKFGVAREKIIVVRMGLNPIYLEKCTPVKETTDILYFGDSSKDRGFDIVYHLAKKLPRYRFSALISYNYGDCQKELDDLQA